MGPPRHSLDTLSPLSEEELNEWEEAYAAVADRHGPGTLHRIGPADIDGVVFKTLEHGMNASLRHVFDKAWLDLATVAPDTTVSDGTDFCRNSRHIFPCGKHHYVVDFTGPTAPTARLV